MPERRPPRAIQAWPARPTARGAGLALAGAAALVAGRGFGTAALAPLGVGFLVLAVGALLVTALAMTGVRVSRDLRPARPRAGEPVEATIGVRGGRLPLAALRLLEWDVDAGLADLGAQRSSATGRGVLRVSIARARRGDHVLPPMTLRAGDGFGLAVGNRRGGAAQRLLVVPETMPAGDTTVALGGRQRGPLAPAGEDVSSLEGLREYQHGDPLSRVHWGQSAKRGRLHTKVFRPEDGGGRIATVLLDASTQAGAREDDRELAVIAAASVARAVATGAGRAVSVGLWLTDEPGPRETSWPEAESRLARAGAGPAGAPLQDALHRAARLLPRGAGLVAVTADPGETLGEAARAVRRAGIDLVLILTGEHAAAAGGLSGVPVLRGADRETLAAALRPVQRPRGAMARA